MNASAAPSRWERLGDKTLTSTRVFDVRSTRFRHPRRDTERDFIIIDSPDWVNVIALTRDQQLVLVRQFRFGTEAFSLEIPGGVIERGEDPLVAGVRELTEETGYTGQPARLLGSVHPNPALQTNRCHFVLVEDATCTHPLDWDEDEEIEVVTMPVEKVLKLAHAGGVTHALALNALLLFEPVWRGTRSPRA
ncbi:NUDIX hydrolase [Opitutus terrae]|uniref:GDP-mannose pyrophosphatase n=1 Tax=Opitutus terrae (strain DSM 11246 / JCM 15787 / PB90-1) TaxID=452637 RepID=B1ZTL7_OPITP|nr:NUDIX hydrolase [Opitutus terrae]ACB73962.1 NUDIX hydrolase [Opitutus terrae PB90-1]